MFSVALGSPPPLVSSARTPWLDNPRNWILGTSLHILVVYRYYIRIIDLNTNLMYMYSQVSEIIVNKNILYILRTNVCTIESSQPSLAKSTHLLAIPSVPYPKMAGRPGKMAMFTDRDDSPVGLISLTVSLVNSELQSFMHIYRTIVIILHFYHCILCVCFNSQC